MISEASFKALAAFCSPSALMTFALWKIYKKAYLNKSVRVRKREREREKKLYI